MELAQEVEIREAVKQVIDAQDTCRKGHASEYYTGLASINGINYRISNHLPSVYRVGQTAEDLHVVNEEIYYKFVVISDEVNPEQRGLEEELAQELAEELEMDEEDIDIEICVISSMSDLEWARFLLK